MVKARWAVRSLMPWRRHPDPAGPRPDPYWNTF